MTPEQYQRAIAYERSIGLAYVGVRLDELCRTWGLDPAATWRLPRWHEQEARRRRVMTYYRLAVISPTRFTTVTGDVS